MGFVLVLVVLALFVAFVCGSAIVATFVLRSARRGASFLVDNPLEERQRLLATSDEHNLDAQVRANGLTGRPIERVGLTAADGTGLVGHYHPSSNGAAVIFVHGLRGCGASMVPAAAPLIEQGFGALLLDLRAHGESEGERLSHGHRELADLDAAVAYVANRPDVDADRIGVLGSSMGATLAILAAAAEPRIRAVVADSPYARFEASAIEGFVGLDAVRSRLVLVLVERMIGAKMAPLAATDRVGAIAPRPILFLAGGRDRIVPADSARKLQQAAGSSAELWFEPELDHLEFPNKAAGYGERITAFFANNLLASTVG